MYRAIVRNTGYTILEVRLVVHHCAERSGGDPKSKGSLMDNRF